MLNERVPLPAKIAQRIETVLRAGVGVIDCSRFLRISPQAAARAARGEFEDAIFNTCAPFTRSASLHLDRLLWLEDVDG